MSVLKLVPMLLFYLPSVVALLYLNYRTVQHLYLNRKRTQQNEENFARLTVALVSGCISWVFLSLPLQIYTVYEIFIEIVKLKTLYLDAAGTFEDFLQNEETLLAVEFQQETLLRSLRVLNMFSGFVNSAILVILVKPFHQPLLSLFFL